MLSTILFSKPSKIWLVQLAYCTTRATLIARQLTWHVALIRSFSGRRNGTRRRYFHELRRTLFSAHANWYCIVCSFEPVYCIACSCVYLRNISYLTVFHVTVYFSGCMAYSKRCSTSLICSCLVLLSASCAVSLHFNLSFERIEWFEFFLTVKLETADTNSEMFGFHFEAIEFWGGLRC